MLGSPVSNANKAPSTCKTIDYDESIGIIHRRLSDEIPRSTNSSLIILESYTSITESNAFKKVNKAVNSISAIINTKDMTIQVSQGQRPNECQKSQNLSKKRKQSKTKNAPVFNKFERSGMFLSIS